MITASHNPAQDNGVKIIDSSGLMMEQSLEPLSEVLINCKDPSLASVMSEVTTKLGLSIKDIAGSVVLIGKDTRASSVELAAAVTYFLVNSSSH